METLKRLLIKIPKRVKKSLLFSATVVFFMACFILGFALIAEAIKTGQILYWFGFFICLGIDLFILDYCTPQGKDEISPM